MDTGRDRARGWEAGSYCRGPQGTHRLATEESGSHASGPSLPAPRPGAAEPRGKFPEGAGPADPDMSTFTSHLEAMTLENRDSEAPEDSP